jgi:hypothetical protein
VQKSFDDDEVERVANQRRRAQPLYIENAQRYLREFGRAL